MTYDDMPIFLDYLFELAFFYDYDEWMTAHLIDRYWKSLKRFDLEAILSAIQQYQNKESHYEKMPMPSDIMRYLSGSLNHKAIGAWEKVLMAKKNISSKDSLVFDDAVIHMVIHDMGGWIKISQLLSGSLEMAASEFQQRYISFSLQPMKKYPCMLTGIHDKENIFSYQIKLPILLGDAEKARHVHLNGKPLVQSEKIFELPVNARQFIFPTED